jgi:hypothetical protein
MLVDIDLGPVKLANLIAGNYKSPVRADKLFGGQHQQHVGNGYPGA